MNPGELVGQGRDAEVFAWGEGQVVKLLIGQGRRAAAEKEQWLASAAARCGIPTPAVGPVVEIDGRAGVVFERVEGVSMMRALLAGTHDMRALVVEFAHIQACIHHSLAPELPTRHDSLAWGIQRAPGLSEDTRRLLLDYLARLPSGETLLHGDYHPDNLMLTPNGLQVIDWVDARCGMPAADVARTYVMSAAPGLPPDVSDEQGRFINSLRREFVHDYLEAYQTETGMTREEIDLWVPPVMAARLREGLEPFNLAWMHDRVQRWAAGKPMGDLTAPLD